MSFSLCFLFIWTMSLPVLLADSVHVVQKMRRWGDCPAIRIAGIHRSGIQWNHQPQPALCGKKLKIPAGMAEAYTVKKGESLGLIAKRFGVSSSDLAMINKINRPDLIRVGQKLTIPLSGSKRPTPPKLLDASTLSKLNSIRPTPGKWQRIIIHHSATPIDDALNMHKVHLNRGMKNGLAYHFVISNGSRKARDGEIYLSNRWKGQLDGGHVKKHSGNKTSIGICLIGNFEIRPPSSKQLTALEGLCEYLMKRCNLQANDVTTHTIFHPKHTVCPGKYFSLTGLRRRLVD